MTRPCLLLLLLALAVLCTSTVANPTLYWSKPVQSSSACPPSPTLIEITCPVANTWTCANMGGGIPAPWQLFPAVDLVGSHFKECRRYVGESLLGLSSEFDKSNNILTFYGGSTTSCLGTTQNFTLRSSESMAIPMQFVQRKCFQLSIASPPTYTASPLCFTVSYMFSSTSSDNCLSQPQVLSMAPEYQSKTEESIKPLNICGTYVSYSSSSCNALKECTSDVGCNSQNGCVTKLGTACSCPANYTATLISAQSTKSPTTPQGVTTTSLTQVYGCIGK